MHDIKGLHQTARQYLLLEHRVILSRGKSITADDNQFRNVILVLPVTVRVSMFFSTRLACES